MANLKNLTSNQIYKGLNNRFDNRVRKMIKLGFRYNKELVCFEKGPYNKVVINNTFVMYVDKFFFNIEISK